MKWTRIEKGVYTSGNFEIRGSGIKWELFEHGVFLVNGKSKTDLQTLAKKGIKKEHIEPENPEEPTESVTITPKAKPNLEDLHGVMCSTYLEITTLSAAIASLAESNRRLANAIESFSKKQV